MFYNLKCTQNVYFKKKMFINSYFNEMLLLVLVMSFVLKSPTSFSPRASLCTKVLKLSTSPRLKNIYLDVSLEVLVKG